MRDKLIELIDDNKACPFDDLACCECEYSDITPCFAGRMADVLIAHGVTFAEDNNVPCKWIPVSERLPEPFVSVLVQMPGEEPCPTVREGYIAGDGLWYAGYYTREPEEVTHWMPMPEFHSKEKQNVS